MLVRCPKHGRVYDSDQAAGCPVCLTEGPPGVLDGRAAKQEEAPKKLGVGPIIIIALLVLALGGGGYYNFFVKGKPTKAEVAYAARRAEAARALSTPVADTMHFAAPSDLAPVRRARSLAGFLESFMHANRATLLRFPAGPVDTADAKGRAHQYVVFARHWHAGLDNATRNGTEFRYQPGVRLAQQMDQVSNGISATVSVLRDVVPLDRVKPGRDRESDLRSAAGYLASARTVLSNLPK